MTVDESSWFFTDDDDLLRGLTDSSRAFDLQRRLGDVVMGLARRWHELLSFR